MLAALALPKTYRVTKDPDGRVREHDVPIVVEFTRKGFGRAIGRPGQDTVDYRWLRGAFNRAQVKQRDGNRVPLHFRHHDGTEDRERAGYIEEKGVRLAFYQGEPRWTTFADFVYDDEAKYRRAKADFPQQSIEVSPEYPDEVNSVALLGDEASYLRFPDRRSFAAIPGGGALILWRSSMAEPEKKPEDEKKPETGVPAKAAAYAAEPGATPAPSGDSGALGRIEALLMKLCEAMESKGERAEETAGGAPIHSPVAAARAEHAAPAEVEARFAARLAQVEAKADAKASALEGRLSTALREVEHERAFKAAKAELAGYALGSDVDAKLRAHVEKGSIATYVDAVKQFAAKLPKADRDAGRPDRGVPGAQSPVLAAYAAKGYAAEAEEQVTNFRALRASPDGSAFLRDEKGHEFTEEEWVAMSLGKPESLAARSSAR